MKDFIQEKLKESDRKFGKYLNANGWGMSSAQLDLEDFLSSTLTEYKDELIKNIKEIQKVEPESNGRYNACQELLNLLKAK